MKSDFPSTLAIDYGTQRIGLARSMGTLAEPWHIVNQDHFTDEKDVLAHLEKLIKAEKFAQVVFGLSENEMARMTKRFAEKLKERIDIPVFFTDETLSSQSAKSKLFATGQHVKNRKTLDHFAAAEFLQEWIDLNA